MGYTHSWGIKKALPKDKFEKFSVDVKKLMEATNLVAGWDGYGEPLFESDSLRFNGRGFDACETFAWDNVLTPFSFCKTNQHPYDEVVCAVLILAKEYYGDSVEIHSDGSWGGWGKGVVLYTETFGREVPAQVIAPRKPVTA